MPYCPACFLERLENRGACPIDGAYYRIRCCPGCAAEIAPDERFCIQCSRPVQDADARVEVVHFPPAPLAARAIALAIDALIIFYVATALPHVLRRLFELLGPMRDDAVIMALVALPWFYFTAYNSGRRQTIGQQVMGLATLRSDREEVDFPRALLRAGILYAGAAALITGVLGIAAVSSTGFADALWDVGLGSRWIPETPVRQAAALLVGLLFVAPVFLKRHRLLHDVAADTDTFAVAG
ncbi:MAG: RDD family protein [Armatimonadetes bacterium]|nr:RDD family protein [Armatimonadota bacterium]